MGFACGNGGGGIWINLQKLTTAGHLLWQVSIKPAAWERTGSACDASRASDGIEVQPTDDGGCLIIVTREIIGAGGGGTDHPEFIAALIRVNSCGRIVWEHDYGTDFDIDNTATGQSGHPIATHDVDIGGFYAVGYGRCCVIDGQIFIELASTDGAGPRGTRNTRKIERLSLADGSWLSSALVDFDTFSGSFIVTDAGCGPCVANTDDGGVVLTRLAANTLTHHYGPDGILVTERGSKGPASGITAGDVSNVIFLGTCASGAICDERVSTFWAGLTVRSITPSASPSSAPDPDIIASTYSTLGNSRYCSACEEPGGDIYACPVNTFTFPSDTGLRRLTISSADLNEVWFLDEASNTFDVTGLRVSRMVADSSGVYACGCLTMSDDSTYGLWKHDESDGSIVWKYQTKLQAFGNRDGRSLCFSSDGDLFLCGLESLRAE